MELIKAAEEDLQGLYSLYRRTAEHMKQCGLNQWNWGIYPTEKMIADDVKRGEMYLFREDGVPAAAIVLTESVDPEYAEVPWTGGVHPGVFHRLAVDPARQGSGIGDGILDQAVQILQNAGCDCIRCDTNRENLRALHLYEKKGFRKCGTVWWDDTPEEKYYALDRILKPDAPLWPVRMEPAFRGGDETPWGGNRLQERYHKKTGGRITGESLEVSCIPGHESTDILGRKLPELIREFGERLTGKYAGRPFPLLLKLIDAREQLSVQVHPGDEYAAVHEHGKLGKNEAWLILDAPENGELIYGLQPGTTLQQLKDACAAGKAVEPLLRRVKVKPWDVCYIPAGCVHAIGAGILLYEIQESSDVTYRFYDWDRKNAEGKGRELHIEQGLAVADLEYAPEPVRTPDGSGSKRLLDEKEFALDIIRCGKTEDLPEIREFGILTVLQGNLSLQWENGGMKLKEGETCLLPQSAPEMKLAGEGCAALAMPNQ